MTVPLDRPVSGSPALRLALISDPHVWRLGVWPWQLFGKRMLGWLNLLLRRGRYFDNEGFHRSLQRAAELGLDLVVINGDLTQTALKSEFKAARRILQQCPLPAVIVPGNHDRYTRHVVRTRRFERFLGEVGGVADYPATFDPAPGFRVIALDPCRPDRRARGRLPDEQMAGLVNALRRCRDDDRLPLIACHYPCTSPPQAPVHAGHELVNAGEMLAALAAHEQRVIAFSGHIHRTWCWQPPAAPNVISVNPGPCGFLSSSAPFGLGFLELELLREPDAHLTVRAHRQDTSGNWQSHDMLSGPGLLRE